MKQRQKGTILIVVIMIITIITIMGSGLLVVTNSTTQLYSNIRKSNQVFWAAEAGINWGLKYYKRALYSPGVDFWSDVDKTLTDIPGYKVKVSINKITPGNPLKPIYWTIESKVYDTDDNFKKRIVVDYLLQDNPFKFTYFYPSQGAEFKSNKDGSNKDIVYGQMYAKGKIGIRFLPQFRAKVTSAAPFVYQEQLAKAARQSGNTQARTLLKAETYRSYYGNKYDPDNPGSEDLFLQSAAMKRYNWGLSIKQGLSSSSEYLKTILDDNTNSDCIFQGGYNTVESAISTPDIFDNYSEILESTGVVTLSEIFKSKGIKLPKDIDTDDPNYLYDSETSKLPYRLKFEGDKVTILKSDEYDSNKIPGGVKGGTTTEKMTRIRKLVDNVKGDMESQGYTFGSTTTLTDAQKIKNENILEDTYITTQPHIYKGNVKNSVYSNQWFDSLTYQPTDEGAERAIQGYPATIVDIQYKNILQLEQVLNEYHIVTEDDWEVLGEYQLPSDLKGLVIDEEFSGMTGKGRNGEPDLIDEFWNEIKLDDDGGIEHIYGQAKNYKGKDKHVRPGLHDANEIFIDGDVGQSLTIATHGSDIKIWDNFVPTHAKSYANSIKNKDANFPVEARDQLAAEIAQKIASGNTKLMILAGHDGRGKYASFIKVHANKSFDSQNRALIFGGLASNFKSQFGASYLSMHNSRLMDFYMVGSIMSGSKGNMKSGDKGMNLFAITDPRYVLGDLPPFGRSTVFIDPYITEADNADDAKYGAVLDGFEWNIYNSEN